MRGESQESCGVSAALLLRVSGVGAHAREGRGGCVASSLSVRRVFLHLFWLSRLSGCPVAANGFKEDAEFKPATQAEGIPDGWMGLDIGARSSARFAEAVSRANTILWNGPMGVFGAWVAVAAAVVVVALCACVWLCIAVCVSCVCRVSSAVHFVCGVHASWVFMYHTY